MKHVLITGGAGFIGSHLCEAFLDRGYAVTALDCFVTGSRDHLARSMQSPEFELVEWNLRRSIPETRMRLLAKYGLHGVLHFACPSSSVDIKRIPFDILEVDSLGTMDTVDLALRHGARYLLASTSEVYGDPVEHPQTEAYFGNVNMVGPRSCYIETKRFAEAYVSTAMRGKEMVPGGPRVELDAAIARIFNTYGPRMRPDDGQIFPEFCLKALQGQEILIYGDGQQTRSFCYVSDLVNGVVRLFESRIRQPVNIGNPDERSVLEIAHRVREITGSTSSLHHVAARADDPRKACPDISLAREALGWKPEVSLREGLIRTIAYFQHLLEARKTATSNQKADFSGSILRVIAG